MTEKEKMLAELPYDAWKDGLPEERDACRKKLYRLNVTTDWSDFPAQQEQVRALFGRTGKNPVVTPPFYCDYGCNIEVGDNFYANFNCTITDVARVQIGDNVMLGPNVTICTAGHPVHPEQSRRAYREKRGDRLRQRGDKGHPRQRDRSRGALQGAAGDHGRGQEVLFQEAGASEGLNPRPSFCFRKAPSKAG